MWLVTYLGLLAAPVIALALSIVAFRIDIKRNEGPSLLLWTILAMLLAGGTLLTIYSAIDASGKGDFDSFAPVLLGALTAFVTAVLAALTGALGLAKGLKNGSWPLQALGGIILFLTLFLPAADWAATRLHDRQVVRNPAERVPFEVYAPGYIPSGYSLQGTAMSSIFSDNGFEPASSDEAKARLVEQTFVRGASLRDSRYVLNEFDARHAKRIKDTRCIDKNPHADPEQNPRWEPYPRQTNPCVRLGIMPSGEVIYVEGRGTVVLASTLLGGTAVILAYHSPDSSVTQSVKSPDLLRMMQSLEPMDRDLLNDRLKPRRFRNS